MLEKFDSLPIQPVYWQGSPNEIIDLGKYAVSVPLENGVDRCEKCAGLSITFLPKPRMTLELPYESNPPRPFHLNLNDGPESLTFSDTGLSFEMYPNGSTDEGMIYLPKHDPIQIQPNATNVKSAIFHVFNWPDFMGPTDCVLTSPQKGHRRLGRIILAAGGWKITICGTDQTSKVIKYLEEKGGYVITHIGKIEKEDSGEFSSEDLASLLVRLRYFFEFSLGAERAPSIAIGYDVCGKKIFEQLGLGFVTEGRWCGSASWFDAHHSNLLSEVLPGFWALSNREVWWKPLTEAIYWYKAANRGGSGLGVDSAMLFSQAALELLAWTYCVCDKKMVSSNAFKPRGLSAADKLRLLVSALSIPLEIPAQMTSLHSKRGKKWDDSMDAITDLRNGLVHPDSDRKVPDGSYYDAWRLSMWYLDLILLRLCGHNGKYANRLSESRYVGTVESVPWAT